MPSKKRVEYVLLYDMWDENGERLKAGTVVNLTKDEAEKMKGKIELPDPFGQYDDAED